MTIKNIALLALTASAMANQDCAPESAWASQSNFAVEFAGGAATMGGSPYSNTPMVAPSGQTWTNLNVSVADVATMIGEFNVEIDTPAGYNAKWNQMTPSANRLGFAGQLNLHYTAVQGMYAGGVYAGVGYNGAHSSSVVKDTFDNTVYKNPFTVNVATDTNTENTGYAEDNTVLYSELDLTVDGSPNVTATRTPSATNALADRAAKNMNMPMAKATVSSGLMFQAGTRFGAMIGNVFPHLRLGWAAYQLKAHMTNQMPTYDTGADIYAASNPSSVILNDGGLELSGTGNALMGIGQRFGNMDPLYDTKDLIKVASKGSKWSNALTLGAGVDWAFQKMTLGFYYQAALCQRVTFDKWTKDMTAGMTASEVNFPTVAQENIGITPVKTSGTVKNTFGPATPKVSMSPVIQTVMFSAKYVINKA